MIMKCQEKNVESKLKKEGTKKNNRPRGKKGRDQMYSE